MTKAPAAVLWDFDGTLVDTESLWNRVERGLARELGGDLPELYHEATVGGTVDATAAYIRATVGTDMPVAEIAAELWARVKNALRDEPIRWLPGVEALVGELAASGVPQALVSSGHRDYLDVTLCRLSRNPFAAVVAGDEVHHNKPHPEGYLRAAAALGVAPADCVVIEDSQPGADAGNAAGCVVVAIPTLDWLPDAPRRRTLPTLDGVTLADLAAVFRDAAG